MDIPGYDDFVGSVDPDLLEVSGREHYRLLAWFSTMYHHVPLIDIGTHTGLSAYALSFNSQNQVYSFDIVDQVTHPIIRGRQNLSFQITDLFDSAQQSLWIPTLLKAPVIFLDVDPHNGHMEIEFYHFLQRIHYQGLLICDDIWYFKGMRDFFWSQIPYTIRHDLTQWGHWSGTGLINFRSDQPWTLMGAPCPPQDWTIVTAYCDLTHAEDHNPTVRPKDYYMERARATMSVPYPLVVYCDRGTVETLRTMRPSHLVEKTLYHVVDFDQLKFEGHSGYEEMTFHEYRQRIQTNRKEHPYQFDSRNTASYYLFCLSRYLMLKETIRHNPFQSTHFAWMNIHMEHMGFKNLVNLDQALSIHRDRFSTCYIDYLPSSLINQTHEYFRWGRCSMCSGFFTGNAKYMSRVCHAIEAQFLIYLAQGYGHADEQLYSPVYFKHPDWFDHYYGEYNQMITNYCHVSENADHVLHTLIAHSWEHRNYEVCHRACCALWEDYRQGYCQLTMEQVKQLTVWKDLSSAWGHQVIPSVSCTHPSPSTIITLLYNVGNPQHVEHLLTQVDQWLQLQFPVIIWTDETYYQRLQHLFQNRPRVQVNQAPIQQFEAYTHQSRLSHLYHQYSVFNRNPNKDTEIYHLLMWSRPEMWKRSIQSNPFQTRTFICMDFGLIRFTDQLNQIERWTIQDRVKMLLIQPYLPQDAEPSEYFHYTHHNVAGGLVTGCGDRLLEVIGWFQQELQDMLDHNWCQLDEAIMACIIRKHPTDIDFYYGDYCGIIDNYMKITNLTNIPSIIQTYLDKNYHVEAQRVLNQIDCEASTEALVIYVDYSILTNYYVLNHRLHPRVAKYLTDSRYQERLTSIVKKHEKNLAFYIQTR